MATSAYCPHCHKHTALSVARAPYKTDWGTEYTAALWQRNNGDSWWIGVCNACGNPSLVKNEGPTIYPAPRPTPTDANIPEAIAADLNEAKMCFSECYRACAAMARRSIQSAALEKGIPFGDLVGQIRALTESGIITKDIEEWATVVRWVGNDAAHPNHNPVTKIDAEDVLKLAEQFLHVIFVTPAIAKARRIARGK
jgi:Domain of unknown function (DUF4145)